MKINILFCLLVLVLFACSEKPKVSSHTTNQLEFHPTFDGLDAFLNYRDKVEQRKDLIELPSLFFTHKSGSTIESSAFLDSKGEILKGSLDKIDTNGQQTAYTFYFLKEVLSMVLIRQNNLRHSNLSMKEIYVFYNAAQAPIASYTRLIKPTHSKTKSKPLNSFQLGKKLHDDIQNNMLLLSDMQNQEGDFTLYFQGFDEAFNKKFVQFGNGVYSTNLAYAPQEALIKSFEKNPTTFQNQTFEVQHQSIQEASGLQYQVLVGIKKR